MKYSSVILLLGSVIMLNGCALYPNIVYKKALKKAPYDAIIVPGYPYEKSTDLNVIYKVRIFWAYYLYKQGVTKNIIFSGSAVHSPYVEGKIMAEIATQMGIPKENIFIEDSAEHSTENLFYGYNLAKEKGFNKIAVATDPFQSGMIAILTSKDKIPVDYIPSKIGTVAIKYWKTFNFNIDSKDAYKTDFVPLAERITKEEMMKGTHGGIYREKNNNKIITN